MEMEVEDEYNFRPSQNSEGAYEFFKYLWVMSTTFLISYGWYLFGLVLLYGFYRHELAAAYRKWRLQRDELAYAAKYHKDSDIAKARMEAVIAAREKLQREHDKAAAEALRKMREKEEKKQQQQGASASTSSSAKKSLRAEYLPLMGDTGSGGYRAPKKSCCKKGGGCG